MTNVHLKTLLSTLVLSTLMTFVTACKAPAPEASIEGKKTLNPAELQKTLSVKLDPAVKNVGQAAAKAANPFDDIQGLPGSDAKTSREEKAQKVRKTYAEKGMFPAVKEYRALMKSSIAEAAFFIDLERELKGDPSMEAVRKAVMSEKPDIALSEAARLSKNKAEAEKTVDDLKVMLIPITLEHAKGIFKRDPRAGFSMAHRLFPQTPIWELEAKLK